jgi:multidrug transporter EmrE-like cation transporter
VFACFGLGAAFQTLAMRDEQMGITYVVVLGLEAITAFLLSVYVLNEGSSTPKLVGVD